MHTLILTDDEAMFLHVVLKRTRDDHDSGSKLMSTEGITCNESITLKLPRPEIVAINLENQGIQVRKETPMKND